MVFLYILLELELLSSQYYNKLCKVSILHFRNYLNKGFSNECNLDVILNTAIEKEKSPF